MSNLLINGNEIHQRLITLGEDWADKNGAASLLEETKGAFLSNLVAKYSPGSKSVAEATNKATADQSYIDHIRNMVAARTAANRAKVRFDSAKVWVEVERTNAATAREEMRSM